MSNRATELQPGLFRSPRPTEAELRAWSPALQTLIDLEPTRYETVESGITKALGILELSVPMSSFWPPELGAVERATSWMADKSKRPLCVHCKQGVDRTGVVVAFWRVRYCRWQPTAAFQEMLDAGFHRNRYVYWMPRIRWLLEQARVQP